MNLKTSLHVAVLIFLNLVPDARSSGVLTIRLTGFRNPYGRTYDGTCCDPSPRDRNPTCVDQCDYVMRLIVMGLGRANDHVFLFHRPLKYDSNNIEFENGDSNLLLTVLFDSWPQDGQVKMNAFFYDYDDFDHTTTLVDWFETDLKHTGNQTSDNTDVWGHFQEQSVVGNRQSDKTLLTFEWSALHSENVYNPAFHMDNAQNNTKLDANINIRNSNLKKSIIQKQGFPIGAGSPFRKNDEQQFYEEFAKRKPVVTSAFVKSVEQLNNEGNKTKETIGQNNHLKRRIIGRHWDEKMFPKVTDYSRLNHILSENGGDQKYDEKVQQHDVDADVSKVERFANGKSIHQDVELKDDELSLKLNKKISAFKRLSQNKGMKKHIRYNNVPFKAHTVHVESTDTSKEEERETIGKNENLTKSDSVIIPELQDSTTSHRESANSEIMNNTDVSESSGERMGVYHLTTLAEARETSEEPVETQQINNVDNHANEETNELTVSEPSTFEKREQTQESLQSSPTHESNQTISVESEMPELFNSNQSNDSEKMNPSDETEANGMGNFKRKIPRIEPYINTIYKTALDHNNIESVKQMLGTIAEDTKPESSVTATNGETTLAFQGNGETTFAVQGETSVENKDKNYAGLKIIEVTPAFENNIIAELSARKYNGQLDKATSIFVYGEMTPSNFGQDSGATTSTISGNQHVLSSAGRGPNSGFSTAWGKEHITQEPTIGKLTAKSYQSRQDAKAVTVYTETNETKKIGTVQTLDFDPVGHKRKTEESTNKNNTTLPSLSPHYRKDIHVVEIINKGGETVPRLVDFTSTTPQNEHLTETKYVTEIASTSPAADAIEMNKFMIDVKPLSKEPVHEKQDGEVTSTGSPLELATSYVELTTGREQPKVWFNARKSHQSNGELLQHNIKVLKTFKFETAAPFQWFVTAQRPYVRPVRQRSEHGTVDVYPDTLLPTLLSNPAVDNADTLIEVDNSPTDITTNGFIPSFDNFAMDSSTKASNLPESITSNARARYEIKSPQSVKETDIGVKNIVSSVVGYSTVKENEPSEHAELNGGLLTTVESNGLLTTVENKDETTTKSYTTINIPLFFLPFERIENVDKAKDGNSILSHEPLPTLETVGRISKSSMVSKINKSSLSSTTTNKSSLSSTTTKSAMTDSSIRSHVDTVIRYKNNSVSHGQSLEASKSSKKDTVFFDILSLIERFDKTLNSPKNISIYKDVVKSIDNIDYLKDAKISSNRSQYVKEGNSLEQVSKREQTKIQEQDQGVFIKEMINPDAMLDDLDFSGGVAHDPSKQSSNTVNNYKNEENANIENIKIPAAEGKTIFIERNAGQDEGTKFTHHEGVHTSMVNNVIEQQGHIQTEGSGQTKDGSNWKDDTKTNFSKKRNDPEYFQDVGSKQRIRGNIQEESKSKEVGENSVINISIKYDDATGNNHDNNHQSPAEKIAEKRQPSEILESRPGNMNNLKRMNVEDKTLENRIVANEKNAVNMRETIPSILLDNKISDAVTNKENLFEKDKKNIISDPAHEGGEGYDETIITMDKNIEEVQDNNNDVHTNVDMASKIMADDNSNNDYIKDEQITTRSNKDIDRNTHERIEYKNVEILTRDTTSEIKNMKTALPKTRITPNDRLDFPASQTQTQSHNSKKHIPGEEDQYLANEFQTDTMPSAHEVPVLVQLKSVGSGRDAVDDVFVIGNPRNDGIPETLNGQASTSLTENKLSKSWPGQSKEYQPSLDIESYSLKKETLEALSLSAPKRKISTTATYKNPLPTSAWIDGEGILENTTKEDIVKRVHFDRSDSLKENLKRPLVAGTNVAMSNNQLTSSAEFDVNVQNFESSSKSLSTSEPRDKADNLKFNATFERNEAFASTTTRQEVTEGQYIESSREVFNPHEITQSTTGANWPQETNLSVSPSNVSASSRLNIKSEKSVDPKEDTITPDLIKNVQIVEHFTNNAVKVTTPSSSTNSGYNGSRTRSNGEYPKDAYISDEYKKDNTLDKDFKRPSELSIEFSNNEIEAHLETNVTDKLIPRDGDNTVTYYKTASVEASKIGNSDNTVTYYKTASMEASKIGNSEKRSPTNDVLLPESSNQTTHDPFDLMNLFIANINLLDSIRDKKNRVDDDSKSNVTAVFQSDDEVILKRGDENSLSSVDSKSIKDDTSSKDRQNEVIRDSNDYDVTDSTKTDNLADDFSSDRLLSDVQNVSSNTHYSKAIELTTTEVATVARQEEEDMDNWHKRSTHQTTTSYLDIAITQSTAPSLSREDELEENESEEIQPAALITTEKTITMDSTFLTNINTVSNLPTETSKDETKTASSTETPKFNGSEPLAITKLVDKPINEVASSGGLTQNIRNILTLDSYPQRKTLGSDKPNKQDPKSLPSIMNPILYIPPTKASLEKQPLLDLYLQSYSHPKAMLNTEMKTLPENGFKLHTVTQDSLSKRPTHQPLHELPWLKLSRVNGGVKRHNVHRKINLDKLRSYIKDIRHGPSVHVPRQGLYTPILDVANQTLRAPDAAAVLPNAVERYGSPYTSINGVSTVFTRYWPAVLGVSIGTMFLLTALITSILCRQRRLMVQRASWSDSPQYLSEPPDPSEYATSSAASLSSDLTRSSVNLVGRHS